MSVDLPQKTGQRAAPWASFWRCWAIFLEKFWRPSSGAVRGWFERHPLARYLAKRLGQSVVVLWVVITLTFMLVKLSPGDPFSRERALPPSVRQQLEAAYRLDAPPVMQYFYYLGDLVQGNLGPSTAQSRSVNEILADHLPVSFELGGYALLIAVCFGVPAGVIAALKANQRTDYAIMSVAVLGLCLPTFVLGPLLALVFGVWLGWLPPAFWYEGASRVLPALSLGLVYGAVLARVTRGGMLEVLKQNYLVTARAKGLAPWTILWKHALRGGLLPTVSVLGPVFAGLISGSFVIETVFQIPGMGSFFVESVFNRDTTLILGTVIVYAVLITLANLAADVAIGLLDPRVRMDARN